jgi:hypothetical protein
MSKKKCGAQKKFPNIETTKLRIDRVVTKEHHDSIKQQTNDFITKLQNEALKNQFIKKLENETYN